MIVPWSWWIRVNSSCSIARRSKKLPSYGGFWDQIYRHMRSKAFWITRAPRPLVPPPERAFGHCPRVLARLPASSTGAPWLCLALCRPNFDLFVVFVVYVQGIDLLHHPGIDSVPWAGHFLLRFCGGPRAGCGGGLHRPAGLWPRQATLHAGLIEGHGRKPDWIGFFFPEAIFAFRSSGSSTSNRFCRDIIRDSSWPFFPCREQGTGSQETLEHLEEDFRQMQPLNETQPIPRPCSRERESSCTFFPAEDVKETFNSLWSNYLISYALMVRFFALSRWIWSLTSTGAMSDRLTRKTFGFEEHVQDGYAELYVGLPARLGHRPDSCLTRQVLKEAHVLLEIEKNSGDSLRLACVRHNRLRQGMNCCSFRSSSSSRLHVLAVLGS